MNNYESNPNHIYYDINKINDKPILTLFSERDEGSRFRQILPKPSQESSISIPQLNNNNQGSRVSNILASENNEELNISRRENISVSSLLNTNDDTSNLVRYEDALGYVSFNFVTSGSVFEEFISSEPYSMKELIPKTFIEDNKLGFKYSKMKYC